MAWPGGLTRGWLAGGSVPVCLFLALLTGWGVARADGEVAVTIVAVDDSSFPVVTAVFMADYGGRPLANLSATDITVTESGAPGAAATIQQAADANVPLALVIAVDTSGSMQGGALAEAKRSATSLANSLGTTDLAALVAFADSAQLKQQLTASRPTIASAIAQLQAAGNTALYDAVAESARVAAASGYARRAVVLLSDGQEFGAKSSLSREQSLARAAEGGALFYAIGVGSQVDRQYLEELASRSGGRYFAAAEAADVPAIYASLEQILRSQFVLRFETTSAASIQERSIRIVVKQGTLNGESTRAYTSQRPPQAVTEEAPAPPTDAAPASDALPAADSGGTFPALLALVPPTLLALAAAVWIRSRAKPRGVLSASVPAIDMPSPAAPVQVLPRPTSHGALLVIGGPATGRFDLPPEPVSVGSGSECGVRLPAVAGVAPIHARIWFRDGQPMLHHVAAGLSTVVKGRSIDIASLAAGDEITIGPVVLRYVQRSQAADGAPVEARGDEAAKR